ncbi:MAG: DNA translocase FtsK [Chloroflexi bacterium]|nr:MAG: DNA translocase FtsK [Chloroflexota bacterium]HDN78849.1 DNA translocase FtsK [Chloroflexota bacterium]
MKGVWELQAEKIEMVLASHNIYASVRSGVITPRYVRYHLYPQIGTKLGRIKALAEEIALFLGVPNCRIYRTNGVVNVEIPRFKVTPVSLLPLCLRIKDVPPCTPVLGIDEEGAPLLISLPSPDVAHILIAGTTGSGKTELTRVMISSLAMYNHQRDLQIVLIDPKGRGFRVFEGLPHLMAPIASTTGETLSLLRRLVREMERRDREGISKPRIAVFIDELAELMLVARKEVEPLLARLTQRGREAGIHLIVCTQKPSVSVIGSLAKANFPVRLVGRVTTPEEAKIASGLAGTGAEKLLGRGDFLAIANGMTIRFQAAYIKPVEIREMVARLQGRSLCRKNGGGKKRVNFFVRAFKGQQIASKGRH